MLKMDVHIDVIHNIEQYDQLVEIFHDMQLEHMFQMLLDFFHPIFDSLDIISFKKKLREKHALITYMTMKYSGI